MQLHRYLDICRARILFFSSREKKTIYFLKEQEASFAWYIRVFVLSPFIIISAITKVSISFAFDIGSWTRATTTPTHIYRQVKVLIYLSLSIDIQITVGVFFIYFSLNFQACCISFLNLTMP